MRVLITGAASQVGRFLLPGLVECGHECLCVSRKPHANQRGVQWIKHDLKGLSDRLYELSADAWIHLAPMDLLPSLMGVAQRIGIRHVIAFSSTSIFTKQVCATPAEKAFISRLTDAEQYLADYASEHDMAWNVFRPTLIYSGMDKNVSFISRMVRRFGIFPLVGDGLRQPVHAEDLARGCIHVLARSGINNRAYNLGGGEVLPYSEMVRRIFRAQGLSPRLMKIHPAPVRLMIRLFRIFPAYRYLTPAMIDRMSQDMVFDYEEARKDFGYSPRPFEVPDIDGSSGRSDSSG